MTRTTIGPKIPFGDEYVQNVTVDCDKCNTHYVVARVHVVPDYTGYWVMDSVTGRPVLTVWFDSHKNRFVYRGRQFKQLHLAVDSAVVEARYGNKSDLNGREFTVADNAAELFAQYLTATYINKDGES